MIRKITYFKWMAGFITAMLSMQGLTGQVAHPDMHMQREARPQRELIKYNFKSRIDGIQKRDKLNPSICAVDTSLYADVGSSLDYRLVFLGNNQDLGIFFNAPQELTLNGFRFYAFLPWDTVAKVESVDVWCKVYKAGLDSLPMGRAIDSVKVTIDTIQGGINFVNTIKDAVFSTPLKIDYNYVIAIENSGTGANAANVVTNNWTTADGLGLNLSKIRLNNRWYHSRDINIDGITFDANFIISPFVKYDLIADFTYSDKCYETLDSLRFNNEYLKSVVSSPFYNEYAFYESTGYGEWCHSWYFNDTAVLEERFHGIYKPNAKFNVKTKLLTYLVPYSRNVDLCYDSSEATVYFQPDRPALTDTNGCVNANEVLEIASNNELTYYWFADSASSTPFNTGNQFAINSFNKDVTYFVTAENNSNAACVWELEPVTFKLTAYPDSLDLKTTSVDICTGAFAILEGASNRGTVWWYESGTGGEPIFKGNVFQTPALNSTTNYFAEANNMGCAIKSGRIRVQINVLSGFAPASPTVSGNTPVCVDGSTTEQVTLNATPASGSSIRWFSSAVSSSPVSTQNSYTVDVYDRGDVYVYVQSWNGACGSSKLPVKVRGNKIPELLATRTEDGCFGDSLKLSGFSTWGKLNWYFDTLNTSNPVASGNFVSIKFNDSGNQKLYIRVSEGDCFNDSWYYVNVNVKPTYLPKSITAESVCRGSDARIELAGLNDETSVLWYESGNSDIVISGDTTLKLGPIFNTTTRYLETIYRGCRSERKPISVDVLDQPVAGFRVSYPTVQSVSLEPINTRNMTIDWRFGDGNTSTDLQPSHTYSAAGTYTVTMIANSTLSDCADTSSAEVQVELNRVESIDYRLNIYPNPVFTGSSLYYNISSKEPLYAVRITDVSGRLVFEQESPKNSFVQIPDYLSEGLYAITFEAESTNYSQWIQVVKQ